MEMQETMSDQEIEIDPPRPPPPHTTTPASDLSNPSISLILYNIFLAVPFSYLVAIVNKKMFQYLGYEKIMRCPSGILGTKALFVVVNLMIVLFWARQIEVEAAKERVERMNAEIQWWDGEIERLEELLVESRLRSARKADQQLKREALAALDSQLEVEPGLKEHGIREWDFVVGAKSPKGRSLGNGGSGLKGLMHSQSKLPKLKKRVVSSAAEKKE